MISNSANSKERWSVVNSVGDVVSDMASLAELQFELFVADSADSSRRLAAPATALLTGLMILAGCFPVLLLALAALLYEMAGLSLATSTGIACLTGMVVAAIVIGFAFRGLRSALQCFERSSTELKRNIEWLKHLNGRNEVDTSSGFEHANSNSRR